MLLSSLTTVCGISSRFVQRTVLPGGIVTVAGEKVKLSMLTAVSTAGVSATAKPKIVDRPTTTAISIAIIAMLTFQYVLFIFLTLLRVFPAFDLTFYSRLESTTASACLPGRYF